MSTDRPRPLATWTPRPTPGRARARASPPHAPESAEFDREINFRGVL